MTNLSHNKQRAVRIPACGLTTRALPLAGYTNYGSGSTSHTVYKGGVLICDVSDTDGYFSRLASGTTVASTDIFGGIAAEKQVVGSSDAADGSKRVTAYVDGTWAFAKGSIAITDIGAVAYATDDDTITTTNTGFLAIGIIVDVDSSYAWVDISDYAGKVSATTG